MNTNSKHTYDKYCGLFDNNSGLRWRGVLAIFLIWGFSFMLLASWLTHDPMLFLFYLVGTPFALSLGIKLLPKITDSRRLVARWSMAVAVFWLPILMTIVALLIIQIPIYIVDTLLTQWADLQYPDDPASLDHE